MKVQQAFRIILFSVLSFFLFNLPAENHLTACPPVDWSDDSLPPPHHAEVVERLHRYYHSDKYIQDVELKVKEAIALLERELAHRQPQQKLAIVSDIDDTVLSSVDVQESIFYGFYPPHFEAAVEKADFPAIQPMLGLVHFAKEKGITIFYVTGRKARLQEATEKNLKAQGFEYFKKVFYKSDDDHEASVVAYKSGARKSIEAEGFDIVLSIGDQESDLSGGYANQTVQLPNYMYRIP